MDLCLLLPGWIKLSDISSKGVISYSCFLELTRCLYKVKIHQQSLIRNPEEGGAWRKQCFPTFHYLYWIFFHLFSYQDRLGNTSETLSRYHCCFCTWEMSGLEPLHSQWTLALLLAFIMGMGIFFIWFWKTWNVSLSVTLLTTKSKSMGWSHQKHIFQ